MSKINLQNQVTKVSQNEDEEHKLNTETEENLIPRALPY